MNAKAFFDLVTKMREAQKEYFRYRSSVCLKKAKELESQVDHEIYRVHCILTGERSLFD